MSDSLRSEVGESTESATPFGLWSAIGLVIANMIGAGVFTTSGFSLADLGQRNYVMFAWVIGGVIAICGAISYGCLARRITESGGEYIFLSRLIHPAIGFVAGWVSLLAGFTGAIAFAAVTFESYAVPDSVRPEWFKPGMAGIGAIIVFGLLHALVVAKGVLTQNLVVAAKMLLLIGFIVYAFLQFPQGWSGMQVEMQPQDFSVFAIASTLVWISLSFSGFNAAVYITSEVSNPKRNVPRALLIGTALVTAFYLILNFVFLYGPSPESIKAQPDVAAIAASSIGGDTLAFLVRLIVSVALLSSISSMVIAGPRVYAKMAEDGVFPQWLRSSKSGSLDVPKASILMQVVFACVVVAFSSIKDLLDYLGFTLSVSAALSVACIFWSSRVAGEGRSKALVYTGIALIYVTATLGLAALSVFNRPQQLYGFAATVVSGLILHGVFAKLGGQEANS